MKEGKSRKESSKDETLLKAGKPTNNQPPKSSHPRSNWVVMIFKEPSRRSTKNQINSQEKRWGVVFNMEAVRGNEPEVEPVQRDS